MMMPWTSTESKSRCGRGTSQHHHGKHMGLLEMFVKWAIKTKIDETKGAQVKQQEVARTRRISLAAGM